MLKRRFWIYVTGCLLLASFFATPALALKPNDPDYFLQWYIEKLGLPQAWDYTTGSREVTVAILDTGVAISHPDLSGNIWVNTDEIGGDGLDNDRNGYVDDINGYDFYDNDADPTPDLSGQYNVEAVTHGTVIAGIVGGVGNNLRGITGIAWNVRLMPLRVLDSNGQADLAPTLKAL
ncbi:MAG: S8 family serine peptidase, partial [Patescibacteria group bacterium]